TGGDSPLFSRLPPKGGTTNGGSLRMHELVRRAFQRPAGRRTPQCNVLNLAGQLEILVRDAACRVRLELDPQLAPCDGEIRMMIGSLAQKADRVDQHQGGRPAVGVVL